MADTIENIKELVPQLPVISFRIEDNIVKALQSSLREMGYYEDERLMGQFKGDSEANTPISKTECDYRFKTIRTPTLLEIKEAAGNLGLDDIELICVIGWTQGEGYWSVGDPYFGYLSACVIINSILDGYYGRGQAAMDKISSWGTFYNEDKQIARYTVGSTNDSVMKLVYLALTNLQTGIHACYGPGYIPDNVFYDPNYKVGDKNIYVW